MGGVVKVLSLISAPLPLFYPRRSSSFLRLSAAAFSTRRRLLAQPPRPSSSTVRISRQIHTETLSNKPPLHDSLHPQLETVARSWPEWDRLVQWLTSEGYVDRARSSSDRSSEDDFVEREGLPVEFLEAGEALILFARENPELLRSLSKKEIAIVVDNVSPILFKEGESSTRRLRNFLSDNYNYVLRSGKAQTIDLIHYLLSYLSNVENSSNNKISDASVKNLLVELVSLSGTTRAPNFAEPNNRLPPLKQDQNSPGQTISRKAGDWFCSKCNFMNFARNIKCLECDEPKPKRILPGGEWECPQCDFFNYGRNMSCLRCDCKRPGKIHLPSTSPGKTSTVEDILNKTTIEVSSNAPLNIKTSGNRYLPIKDKDPAVSQTLDRILGREPNNPSWESLVNQRQEPGHVPFNPLPADMFTKSKTTEMEAKSRPDEEFRETMPARKGENRFVVSRKKDRSLTSPQYKRRIAMEQANNSNSDFVPFVPFPPDYFAKKRENKLSEMEHTSKNTEETNTRGINMNSSREASHSEQPKNKSTYSNSGYSSSQENWNSQSDSGNANGSYSAQPSNPSGYKNYSAQSSNPSGYNNYSAQSSNPSGYNNYSAQPSNPSGYNDSPSNTNYSNSKESWNKSLEGSAVREPDTLDMSEEAKAERWFKRAAQIKDISELENIPDEDFPEIMPMRKGVNRFVITKRKTPLERRLTSSQYRRNLPIVKSDAEKDERSNFDRA